MRWLAALAAVVLLAAPVAADNGREHHGGRDRDRGGYDDGRGHGGHDRYGDRDRRDRHHYDRHRYDDRRHGRGRHDYGYNYGGHRRYDYYRPPIRHYGYTPRYYGHAPRYYGYAPRYYAPRPTYYYGHHRHGHACHSWSVGQTYPYWSDAGRYHVIDYSSHHLPPPSHGQYWVDHDGDALLIGAATGLIVGLAIHAAETNY